MTDAPELNEDFRDMLLLTVITGVSFDEAWRTRLKTTIAGLGVFVHVGSPSASRIA